MVTYEILIMYTALIVAIIDVCYKIFSSNNKK